MLLRSCRQECLSQRKPLFCTFVCNCLAARFAARGFRGRILWPKRPGTRHLHRGPGWFAFVLRLSCICLALHEGGDTGNASKAMREKIRRPVTMTALTAILGLLPAALSTRIGAQTQRPLAIVVVGGMLTTLFLTRYLMPGVIQLLWSSVAAVGGWVDCPTNCRFPANQKPEAMAVFA